MFDCEEIVCKLWQ